MEMSRQVLVRTHLQDRRVNRNLHILPASVRRKDDNGLVCRHGDQRNFKRRVAESGGGLSRSQQLIRSNSLAQTLHVSSPSSRSLKAPCSSTSTNPNNKTKKKEEK